MYNLIILQKNALKVSGLTKRKYNELKRTLEKILNISENIDIAAMCVRLGINSNIQKLAQSLLTEYTVQNPNLDCTHPQYRAMAISQACNLEKQKIETNKLIEMSNLKQNQWKKLEIPWKTFIANRKVIGLSSTQSPTKIIVNSINNIESTKSSSDQTSDTYDVWRKNLIEKAFNNLVKSGDINILHFNILKYILNLSSPTYTRAVQYFKDFCKELDEDTPTINVLDPKYACILVLKAALETGCTIERDKLKNYSKLNNVEWTKFQKEWDENYGSGSINLDESDIEIPEFHEWYKICFADEL